MSTETVRVTGAISMSNGQPLVSTKFNFVLTKAGVDPSSNVIIPATPVSATSSSSGNISVELWPNDRGFGNTLYKVSAVIGGIDVHIGDIQVLQDGSNQIGEMLAITDYKEIDAEIVGIENALRAETAATLAQGNADAVDPDQIEARAVADAKARAPLGPNFMKDTRYWAGLCEGQVGVEYDVRGGLAVGGPWGMRISDGVEATLKVVELDDPELAAITANQGQLSELFGEDPDQVFCRAVIMDVTITSDDDEAMFDLRQLFDDRAPFVFGGEHMQQGHAGVAVLSHAGEAYLRLFANVAHKDVDGTAAGAGWLKVYGSSSRGYQWAEARNYIRGKGSMRVAVLMPYCSTGDHGDIAIWAPHAGGNPYSDA